MWKHHPATPYNHRSQPGREEIVLSDRATFFVHQICETKRHKVTWLQQQCSSSDNRRKNCTHEAGGAKKHQNVAESNPATRNSHSLQQAGQEMVLLSNRTAFAILET